MRLTQKKVEAILTDILGEDGLPLIKYLQGRQNISEFDLANKTKKDIKVIRKMLYLLYNHNLVGFIRKKDKQKGWYIYYWTLLSENIKFAYFRKRKELLERLVRQREIEGKELFFVCPDRCVRLNFDQSSDFEFHCPECGELISQDSSEDKIKYLEKEIKETTLELEQFRMERQKKRKTAKVRQKAVRKKVGAAKKKKKARKFLKKK